MTHGFNWRDEVGKAEAQLANVVERKVKAATTVATGTALVLSVLGLYVFHGTVPDWVQVAVGSLVTGALTGFAGWWAKHTPRTLPDPGEAPPATGPDPAPGSPSTGPA